MALQTWTGTISGNADLVNDTHQQTGNCTIADATTFTWSIAGATTQDSINSWNVTGGFSITVNGKIIVDGAFKKKITFQSSIATPLFNSWLGFDLNQVDPSSSISYVIIKNASVALDYGVLYVTDNLSVSKVLFKSCDFAVRSTSTATVTISSYEVMASCDDGSGSAVLSLNAAGTVNVGTLYLHDCGNIASLIAMTAGAIAITKLVLINPGNGSITRTSGTPSLTIGKIYSYATHGLFISWTLGTLDINGGIMSGCRGSVFNTCLNILGTVDDLDVYMRGVRYVNVSGPNFNNGFLSGGSNGTNSIDQDKVDSTSGGSVDGIADVNTSNYSSTDSVTNARATPNNPKTITNVSVGTPTTNSIPTSFDSNYPGACWLVFSKSSKTVNQKEELSQYEFRTPISYYEWLDYSGENKLIDTVSRVMDLTALDSGTRYYFRAVVEMFDDKDLMYSAEFNAKTTGDAPSTEGGVIKKGRLR